MRDKLRELGLRLTELATYLGISRPTLYKYLEDYELRNFKGIDLKARKVFDYIMKKRTISKIEVINYIISFEVEDVESELIIKRLLQDSDVSNEVDYLLDNSNVEEVYQVIKNRILRKED